METQDIRRREAITSRLYSLHLALQWWQAMRTDGIAYDNNLASGMHARRTTFSRCYLWSTRQRIGISPSEYAH